MSATASLGSLKGRLGNLNNNVNTNIVAAIQREKSHADSISQAYKVYQTYTQPPVIPVPPVGNYQPMRVDYTQKSANYNNKPYVKRNDDSLRNSIIADIVNDGIINKSHDNLSFKISTTEFIVNYKKQPDDVYQKYRAKYVKILKNERGEWSWMYNYDTAKGKGTESISTKNSN